MTTMSNYGPCLTSEEYQRAVVALYRRAAEGRMPAALGDIEQAIKDAEFNLQIDYKLGRNFPAERRQALLAAKHRAEKGRLSLVRGFVRKLLRKRQFAGAMQLWLERLTEEFAKVLSPDELNALMELKPGEKPVLPIEADKL